MSKSFLLLSRLSVSFTDTAHEMPRQVVRKAVSRGDLAALQDALASDEADDQTTKDNKDKAAVRCGSAPSAFESCKIRLKLNARSRLSILAQGKALEKAFLLLREFPEECARAALERPVSLGVVSAFTHTKVR